MPEMPTIKIPAWLRFVLYLAAAIALLASSYFLDRGFTWWGPAEVKLTQGIVALINVVALGRVTREMTSSSDTTAGEVVSRVDDTTTPVDDYAGVIEGGA